MLFLKSEVKLMEKLTQRELEVLALLTHGFSNKDIAKILFITERTVKAHLSSILKKLNARNRIAAVVKGISLCILNTKSK